MIERRKDCVGCDVCYNCGRKNEYEVYVCDKCGGDIDIDAEYEEPRVWDGKDLCEDCYKQACGFYDALTFDNALKAGAEKQVSVKLNGFLAWFLTNSEIEEALIKVAREAGIDPEDIESFVNDFEIDVDDFMEIVKGVA